MSFYDDPNDAYIERDWEDEFDDYEYQEGDVIPAEPREDFGWFGDEALCGE